MLNIGSFECQLFTLKEETITAIGIKMIKNWILSYLIDLQKCYDNCSFLLNYVFQDMIYIYIGEIHTRTGISARISKFILMEEIFASLCIFY